MLSHLTVHKQKQQVEQAQRVERKDFTRAWNTVLAHQRRELQKVPTLPYKRFKKEGNILTFELSSLAPDILPWPDSAPIAYISKGQRQHTVFLGHLMNVNANEVQVAWEPPTIQEHSQIRDELPPSGSICVFQQEALAALDRQRWALNNIMSGGTVNSRLPDVLLNISTAKFDAIDMNIEFYQKNLADDKKKAVRQALAAQDIFLLQGPPGTGKTTTLAEIILQILKVKPNARILVSSQSNVAVNHVLSSVAKHEHGKSAEIVRIGRAEKIGHGAEGWMLEQRLSTWREEVLERTDPILAELKEHVQQQRQWFLNKHLPPEYIEELTQCKAWIEELKDDLEELIFYKNQITILQKRSSIENTQKDVEVVSNERLVYEKEAQEKAEHISTTLDLIRSYLPEASQGNVEPSLSRERERLDRLLTQLLTPSNLAPSREAELLELVQGWRKVFGKRDDFAEPLLERANILAATCLITGGRYLKDQEFDWAIIDEAGRATAPELLVPIVRSRRAIIVGDERQLPPMLDENLTDDTLAGLGITKESLEESLFETLVNQGKNAFLPAVQMLTVQHRMHPAIGRLVSTVFYEGKLENAVDANERIHGLAWLPKAVVWYSTAHLPRHSDTERERSYYNRSEVHAIVSLLRRMEISYQNQHETREIAIITPYNAQIAELRDRVKPDDASWKALKIEIATVDAFQGRDRDIVLYSTVRSNKELTLGFLKDQRRLNVALSRARQLLIIVGDIWMLENGRADRRGNPYQELIQYMRDNANECLIQDIEMEGQNG